MVQTKVCLDCFLLTFRWSDDERCDKVRLWWEKSEKQRGNTTWNYYSGLVCICICCEQRFRYLREPILGRNEERGDSFGVCLVHICPSFSQQPFDNINSILLCRNKKRATPVLEKRRVNETRRVQIFEKENYAIALIHVNTPADHKF